MSISDKENGRSMIEMLGVLAIIGVLSVGGIAGYSKAMHRYRVNKTIEQIIQIAANVRSFFAPQKTYEGLCSYCDDTSRGLLKKSKLVPDEMWNGINLINPLGGKFNIGTTKKNDNNACQNDPVCKYQAFFMMLYNVPEEACIDLLIQDWNNAGVSYIKTYNLENPVFGSDAAYFLPPVSIDQAAKVCAVQADDSDLINYIDLIFDADASYITSLINYTQNKLNTAYP